MKCIHCGEQPLEPELLTADEVLDEVDRYCQTTGNPALAGPVRQHYETTADIVHAAVVSLKLEKVVLWRKKAI